ncbi:MAG: DUF192 domain-containing protein [Rhodothermia bacterium]|nr:DUF192 domain-containing protein [Rhodothermia bacterium]
MMFRNRLGIEICAIGLVIAGMAVGGCGKDEKEDSVLRGPEFNVEGMLDFVRPDGSLIVRIALELAESRDEQTMGLMRRRSLPARGGMLFIYDQEQPQSFWMKNTPMPLDIIFIASDSSIVNIARRTTPLSEQTIESTGPAQYVLELRAGFADRYGIDESVRIKWQRT